MGTTIRIQDELAERAKQLALRTGRTLGEVVEDALREVLSRRDISQRQEPIEFPGFNLGGLLPGVDLDCSADLLDR